MRLTKYPCFQKSPNYFQGNVEQSLRLQLPIQLLITIAGKFAWYWKFTEGPFDGICLPIMELPSNYAHFQKSPAFTTKSNILHKRMKSVFTFFTGTETAQFSALGVSPDCGGIWDIYGVCRIYEGTQSGRPILHTAGNGWNRKISLKFLVYYKWLYATIPSFVYHSIFFHFLLLLCEFLDALASLKTMFKIKSFSYSCFQDFKINE